MADGSPNLRQPLQPQLANPTQFIRSPEFRDVYSNFVRVGVSPTDINVSFSKLIEPTPGITMIEDQALVRMSPQQFKVFVDQASKMLKAWEDVFGEITHTVKPRSQESITQGILRLKEAIDKANP